MKMPFQGQRDCVSGVGGGVNFERREEDCSMLDRTAKQESPFNSPFTWGIKLSTFLAKRRKRVSGGVETKIR